MNRLAPPACYFVVFISFSLFLGVFHPPAACICARQSCRKPLDFLFLPSFIFLFSYQRVFSLFVAVS